MRKRKLLQEEKTLPLHEVRRLRLLSVRRVGEKYFTYQNDKRRLQIEVPFFLILNAKHSNIIVSKESLL